jgi:hypothetical protein
MKPSAVCNRLASNHTPRAPGKQAWLPLPWSSTHDVAGSRNAGSHNYRQGLSDGRPIVDQPIPHSDTDGGDEAVAHRVVEDRIVSSKTRSI